MVSEFSGSVLQRLSSPILGTYTTYLMIFHWKVFVVLFSGGTASEKIVAVETILNKIFLWNIGGALLFTLVTLLGLPFLKSRYDKFLSDRATETSKYLNRNIRNVARENVEAEGAIRNVIRNNSKVIEIQNICQSLKSTLDLYERVVGLRGGSQGDLKITLENNINDLLSRISQVKVAISELEKDSGDLAR